MCGLNVLVGGTAAMVERMNAAIAHRGVRSHVVWVDPITDLHMGHVRLPIQGLADTFDQPRTDGPLTVAFVGEILNYQCLQPRTQSDVVVLSDMLRRFGESAFEHFHGFWSVAVFDQRDRTLNLYTDELAKKPLYMRVVHDEVIGISSQIAPLLTLGRVEFWDRAYLAAVRKWGYCPTDATAFDGIVSLPPGTCTTIQLAPNGTPTSITRHQYRRIRRISHGSVRNALSTSVEERLVSDVPVGILLSGGLDSTLVYQLARRVSRDLTVFHVDNEESEFLNAIDLSGVDVQRVSLGSVTMEDAVRAHESPVDLGSVIPQYALAQAIKRHEFRVVLSGDGADELFGGYRRAQMYDSQGSDVFHELVHYHLPRLDRLMMSGTIELRCPFLARDVMGIALDLPWAERRAKEFLKREFEDVVPAAILNRAKKPLKIASLIEDRAEHQRRMMDAFVRVFQPHVKESFE